MRPYIAVLAFLLGLVSPQSDARAHDFLGMRPGMPATEAIRILSRRGRVEKVPSPDGYVSYFGNRYTVSLCRDSNIVQSIDHYFDSKFETFSTVVTSEQNGLGHGSYRLYSDKGKNPFNTIEIYWTLKSGEAYSVNYTSFGSSSRVSENVQKACAR